MTEKNKVDIDKIDLEKEREKITEFPGLIDHAHTIGSAIIKPEDKGRIKGNAVAAMRDQTGRQFKQLYGQMLQLVRQAEDLKRRVEVSERIYESKLSFKPVYHKRYYLYQREEGDDILSMVAPEEWGRTFPFKKFVAEVELLSDHTWEVIRENKEE